VTPIRLLPITPDIAARLLKRYAFFTRDIIPGSSYPGLDMPTQTISTPALWIVGAQVSEKLVYDVTQALWRDANRRILDGGHPMGRHILLATALDGLILPLHPGATRFYREAGLKLPVETQ
jgi:TRAP transporter TAXI family solute receptor